MIAAVTLSDLLEGNKEVYVQLANAILTNHPSRTLYTQIPKCLMEGRGEADSVNCPSTDEESEDEIGHDEDYHHNDVWYGDCNDNHIDILSYSFEPKLAEIPCDQFDII